MSQTHTKQINSELKRWLVASQKLRRSASICYGKIKSNIATLEPIGTKEEMDKLQDETGKLKYKSSKNGKSNFKGLEMILDKIGKNANYCLETLTADVESLECRDDFVQIPKRKRKSDDASQCKTPIKKRKPTKKNLLEAAREAEEAGETSKKVAKMFINEQAEGKFYFFFF